MMKPTRQLIEKFAEELHGSGVDSDWSIKETKQSFISTRINTGYQHGSAPVRPGMRR